MSPTPIRPIRFGALLRQADNRWSSIAEAARIGGSRLGGIVGAIGFTLFLPVPIVGTLIGALAGTFIGAVAGEVTGEDPKTLQGSFWPAVGATIGRVVGTLGVVGPTRMAYERVIPIVDITARLLSNALSYH